MIKISHRRLLKYFIYCFGFPSIYIFSTYFRLPIIITMGIAQLVFSLWLFNHTWYSSIILGFIVLILTIATFPLVDRIVFYLSHSSSYPENFFETLIVFSGIFISTLLIEATFLFSENSFRFKQYMNEQ